MVYFEPALKVYVVANITEAVELAYKFKQEGRYNWFRGQVEEWPPVSSLHRVRASGDSKMEILTSRYVEMFFEWLATIPELQYLKAPEHINDVGAILQHYGIPTHFIDFTTDPGVAAFFAADTATPPSRRHVLHLLS